MSNISTSDPAEYYGIHTGPWINWSDGPILGGTITLTRRNGGFLISLVALFVTWTGTAFWRVACYFFHHYFSSEAPRDGIYHQRQAILRNSANGVSGLCALVQVAWVWSRKTTRTYRRVLPLLGFTITCLSCFALAGVFSSKIATSTGSHVLISSPSCGHFDELRELNQTLYTSVYAPYRVKKDKDFANYAQNCYTNLSSSEECQRYVQQQLPWSANRNASCQFGGELCKNRFGNLELDSGFIDSNNHLGLNDPPERRFRYRSLLKCAPIKSDGYKEPYTHSSEGQEVQYMRYYYGGIRPGYNYTYQYAVGSYEETKNNNATGANEDYVLGIRQAKYSNGSLGYDSTFTPIPELRQLEGDVSLFFLSANFVLFTRETDDPWYSAHNQLPTIGISQLNGREKMYFADEPASALACASQYELCTQSGCTAPGSLADTFIRAKSLQNDKSEGEIIDWSTYALSTSIERVVGGLGNSGLTSRYALWVGVQSPLPSNQWQLEVEHWFTVWLATLQGSFVVSATGPSDPEVMRWVQTPRNEGEKRICRSQKIATTAYTNFNTFGLCLTLIVGTIIIVVSYTVESVASWIQKRRNFDVYSRLEWCTNETLQLQRMAHEELGVGTWHDGAGTVPYTDNGERLATMDITNPHHPRLKVPPPHFDELLARGNDEKARPSSEEGLEHSMTSAGKPEPASRVREASDASPSGRSENQVSPKDFPSVEELEHVERQTGVLVIGSRGNETRTI